MSALSMREPRESERSVRIHRASRAADVGAKDHAVLGFRDVDAARVVHPERDIGRTNAGARANAPDRLADRTEHPYRAESRVNDDETSVVGDRHPVGSGEAARELQIDAALVDAVDRERHSQDLL